MAEPILEIRGLTKRFGGLVATDALSLEVAPDEVHALIGPNGAGKTTLIAQIMGEIRPDAGSVLFDGKNITGLSTPARIRRGIARSFQITAVLPELTAADNVALAVQATLGHSFHFWRATRHDARLRRPAQAFLERVGLAGRADVAASELSHGERRQLEIAIALALRPRLLLLDEPMAGMGIEETKRMVGFLQTLKRKVGILLVEHDMDVVFALADRISVLVQGRRIASGPPAAIRADPEVRAAYLTEDEEG